MPDESKQRAAQHQDHQPGTRGEMSPPPDDCALSYRGSGKLAGKAALVTGGDSGIGRSVAISFAKEGADVAVMYLDETEDAQETERFIKDAGVRCHLHRGDVGAPAQARSAVEATIKAFGRLDILVNNAAVQFPEKDGLSAIKIENLHRTFETNIFAMFYLTQAAVPHLTDGSVIVNTTSITAFRGSPPLIDYSATKGAIVAFTRSLAKSLVEKGIRVNAVAPGPVWTPLIPSSFDAESVAKFGSDNPMGRAAKADEISPSYVFLASRDAAFMTGQILHLNGGEYFG